MKKLLRFALIVGAVAFAAKLLAAQKAEWQGITESEARAKLDAKLPSKVPADQRVAVADKVVAKLRERGMLREEIAPVPSSGVESGTEFEAAPDAGDQGGGATVEGGGEASDET